MRFLCDSCGTKYSISDERVRGRVLKIRCKKCDFVITVREDSLAMDAPESAGFEPAESDQTVVGGLDSVGLGAGKVADATASGKDDWYLSFDGEQEGPFSLQVALSRVQQERSTGKEAHAWRPGFLVWLPIEEVPELAQAPAAAARPPVRATTPTPVGGVRANSGAVSNQVARDPSGPRAALSVSAGARGDAARPTASAPAPAVGASAPRAASAGADARLDLRKTAAPPIPSTARGPIKSLGATRSPVANGSGAVPSVSNGSGAKPLPAAPASNGSGARPLPAAPAPFGGAVASAKPAAPVQPGMFAAAPAADPVPDLPISNEASGLVDLSKLADVALGRPTTGQAFINGHTGRVPTISAPEPLTALEPPENASAPAPVVVVAGAAPRGTSPVFKYVAIASVLGLLGLGGAVIYLLTHRPEAETIIVTEPSRRADDSPITMADPSAPKGGAAASDPKKPAPSTGKKVAAAPKGTAPTPGPAKSNDSLSGSQRALADLYKDDGDRATPHGVPGAGGGRSGEGGQVSQSAIIAAVTANKRTLSLCYERALKHDQSLKSGRVPIQVTVGMSGRVTSVNIPEQQYASSELGQCFVQAVKRWNFPSADAGYSTEFPFILQAQ